MQYISSIERIATNKGIQQGIQQAEETLLEHLLKRKFSDLPSSYQSRIQQADSKTLFNWIDRILEAETIEEVFND